MKYKKTIIFFLYFFNLCFFLKRSLTNFLFFLFTFLFYCNLLNCCYIFMFLLMDVAFMYATNFNQDIGKWNTGKVETMGYSKWTTKNNNFLFIFFQFMFFFRNALTNFLFFLFTFLFYFILWNCSVFFSFNVCSISSSYQFQCWYK